MPLSMSQASVPLFVQGLNALSGVLRKAEDHATARKIDPAVLLQARLFPDMLPMVRQVQIAGDFAKGTLARLAGEEAPSYPDEEASFEALQARVERTLAYVGSVAPQKIDGSETRTITLKIAGQSMEFEGQPYLLHFALPNFFFHLSTAYNILRHNGVEIGKRDFIGKF